MRIIIKLSDPNTIKVVLKFTHEIIRMEQIKLFIFGAEQNIIWDIL
jgi:hypothetical protein